MLDTIKRFTNNNFGLRTSVATVFPDLFEGDYSSRNKSKEKIEMQEQLIEEIKPIKGYEGSYSISNYGYAISEAKEWVAGRGVVRKKERTILRGQPNPRGYLIVRLYKNKTVKNHKIHHLVWDHFGDSPRNGRVLQVDHIKPNKLNNRIDNLQLLTNRKNCIKYLKTQNKSSKYIGVHLNKSKKKWIAQITNKKEHRYLGSYGSEYLAKMAYENALTQIYETGRLNIKLPPRKIIGSSKYLGVCWDKSKNKWVAGLKHNGKKYYLGRYDNEYDAHLAYQKKLKEIGGKEHGRFKISKH